MFKARLHFLHANTTRVHRDTYLCVLKGTVGGDGGDFAGVFADVTVKARRRIQKVLHVFINALHFALEPNIDTISTCTLFTFTCGGLHNIDNLDFFKSFNLRKKKRKKNLH